MDVERFLAKRDNFNGEIVPVEKSWEDIKRRLAKIEDDRQRLINGVAPVPWWEQMARQKLARLLPQLRDHLDIEPLSRLSGEIRQLIFDLYAKMPEIYDIATAIDEYAASLEELLQKIEKDPENNDLVNELDRLQNEDQEKKLNLPRNDKLEKMIRAVQDKDPNFRETLRKEVIEQAQRYLSLEGPKIVAARSLLVGSTHGFRRLKKLYSEVERQKDDLDKLHTTAGYLVRGEELGITVWNTAVGQLEQVVAIADLVYDAAQASKNFIDPDKLQKLHDNADKLEDKVLGAYFGGKRKELPEATDVDFKEVT